MHFLSRHTRLATGQEAPIRVHLNRKITIEPPYLSTTHKGMLNRDSQHKQRSVFLIGAIKEAGSDKIDRIDLASDS